jgi:hypothetical protein
MSGPAAKLRKHFPFLKFAFHDFNLFAENDLIDFSKYQRSTSSRSKIPHIKTEIVNEMIYLICRSLTTSVHRSEGGEFG